MAIWKRVITDLDIGVAVQAYDAQLDTWSGVAPSANGQSLVAATNYAGMRGLLDLEAGTDFYSVSAANSAFQAAGSYQVLDAGLTAIAGLGTSADKMIYTTASDVYATSTISSVGRTLVGGASAAAMMGTLGATSIGKNLVGLANPGAITFPRFNANNSISSLSATDFRTAIGAGSSSASGTVTSVAALTLGTSGTDVSSTVANGTTAAVVSLQIPTASASNRGALSAANWSTFNAKTTNTGTVTSVTASTASTNGLSLSGGAITGSGTIAITGTLALGSLSTTGNAGTATTLATTRAINGVNFNGSAAITVTANATTLSGTSLKSTVVGSSLTSVGTITSGTWSAGIIPEAKLQNQSGTNTGNETKGTINALAITTVGQLASGTIGSGFGTINNGSSSITTTGTISCGTLQVSTGIVNATTETLSVKDSKIILNSDYSGTAAFDAGFIVERSTTGAVGQASASNDSCLYWDESVGRWTIFQSTTKAMPTAAPTQVLAGGGYVVTTTNSTAVAAANDGMGIGSMHVKTDTNQVYIRTS